MTTELAKKGIPLLGAVALLTLALVLSGCQHEKPNFTYMPDMAFSPAVKAQEDAAFLPVPGTVPRGHDPYRYADQPELAGRELKNPLKRTRENFLRGQDRYNIYCSVCHGQMGEGDGPVAPKFGRPPSLLSEKVTDWPDARIFHVITMGQNLMPSYATQVDPEDRWAIALYIRALQRAKNPRPSDLERAKDWP